MPGSAPVPLGWTVLIVLVGLASCTTIPEEEPVPEPEEVELHRAVDAGDPALNVSIETFEWDAQEADTGRSKRRYLSVGKSESGYLPFVLRNTLVDSGYWGAVRVVPGTDPTAEVLVTGRILLSDGVRLGLSVSVRDATGRRWFSKVYEARARKPEAAYREETATEPFSDLFNRIANDMSEVRDRLDQDALSGILDSALLRYAMALSPEAFSEYLETNREGEVILTGLPARTDPMYTRVKRIRESEYQFIDTVDRQYEALYRKMRVPYGYWRYYAWELTTYNEKIEKSGSIGRKPPRGTWAELDNVYRTYRESKMNEDALRELAASLDAEVSPIVTRVEGEVIRLTGTLESQYRKWRELLRSMYEQERAGS